MLVRRSDTSIPPVLGRSKSKFPSSASRMTTMIKNSLINFSMSKINKEGRKVTILACYLQ